MSGGNPYHDKKGKFTEAPNAATVEARNKKILGNADVGYKDKQGYTTFTVPKRPGSLLFKKGEPRDGPGGEWSKTAAGMRQGQMYIMSPKGEVRKGGFWMDWAEKGVSKAEYAKMPITQRMAMENRNQGTLYQPLKKDFASRVDGVTHGQAALKALTIARRGGRK